MLSIYTMVAKGKPIVTYGISDTNMHLSGTVMFVYFFSNYQLFLKIPRGL